MFYFIFTKIKIHEIFFWIRKRSSLYNPVNSNIIAKRSIFRYFKRHFRVCF